MASDSFAFCSEGEAYRLLARKTTVLSRGQRLFLGLDRLGPFDLIAFRAYQRGAEMPVEHDGSRSAALAAHRLVHGKIGLGSKSGKRVLSYPDPVNLM